MKKRFIVLLIVIMAVIGIGVGVLFIIQGKSYLNVANPIKNIHAGYFDRDEVEEEQFIELAIRTCLGPMETVNEEEESCYYVIPIIGEDERGLLIAKVQGYALDEWKELEDQAEKHKNDLIDSEELQTLYYIGRFEPMSNSEYENAFQMVDANYGEGLTQYEILEYVFVVSDPVLYQDRGINNIVIGIVLLVIATGIMAAICICSIYRKVEKVKMQNLSDLIKERRSIKKYKADVMVPEEMINQVIEAGLYAASGRGKQAPVIIAVTNKELRDKIAEKNRQIGGFPEDVDPFYGAPVILIVIADATVNTAVYDGSLALGNMMLMAHDLGLGSCWIHRAKEEFEEDFGKEILKDLGIEGDYVGVGHLALGYADTELPKVPARKENRVYYTR